MSGLNLLVEAAANITKKSPKDCLTRSPMMSATEAVYANPCYPFSFPPNYFPAQVMNSPSMREACESRKCYSGYPPVEYQYPPYFGFDNSSTITMKILRFENSVHLVPATQFDACALMNCAASNSGPQHIQIVLQYDNLLDHRYAYDTIGSCLPPPTKISAIASSPQWPDMPSSSGSTCEPVFELKHIYKTSSDTYRVQIGKGSKAQRNGKFSRNTQTEYEALWLCELALVAIDCPSSLDDIIRGGNYKSMLEKGLVLNPTDFAIKLVDHAEQYKIRQLLRDDEVDRAVAVFRTLFPPALLSSLAAGCSLFDRPPLPTEAILAPQTRKRRRSLKTTIKVDFEIDPHTDNSNGTKIPKQL